MDYPGLVKRLRLSWPKQEEAADALEHLLRERDEAAGRAQAADKRTAEALRHNELLRQEVAALEELRPLRAQAASLEAELFDARQKIASLQAWQAQAQATPVRGYALLRDGAVLALACDAVTAERLVALHGNLTIHPLR